MRPVVDIIGDVVTAMSAKMLITPIADYTSVNYLYGTLEEMGGILAEWTKKPTVNKEQFPLICLVQPFEEDIKNKGYEVEVPLNVLILTDSKQEYKAADRYTYSFKPILYPLWDLFISRLRNSKEISPEISEYKKTDHIDWGKLTPDGKPVTPFSDFLDGIELKNLTVKIFKTN